MIILGRIVDNTISALDVGQDHMLPICAECQQIQVGKIIFVYAVVAHIIPQEIAPASPMTTGKSPVQHHRIFTVMDHMMEQIPNIWEYPEEMHGILQISGQHLLKIWEIHPSWSTGIHK